MTWLRIGTILDGTAGGCDCQAPVAVTFSHWRLCIDTLPVGTSMCDKNVASCMIVGLSYLSCISSHLSSTSHPPWLSLVLMSQRMQPLAPEENMTNTFRSWTTRLITQNGQYPSQSSVAVQSQKHVVGQVLSTKCQIMQQTCILRGQTVRMPHAYTIVSSCLLLERHTSILPLP